MDKAETVRGSAISTTEAKSCTSGNARILYGETCVTKDSTETKVCVGLNATTPGLAEVQGKAEIGLCVDVKTGVPNSGTTIDFGGYASAGYSLVGVEHTVELAGTIHEGIRIEQEICIGPTTGGEVGVVGLENVTGVCEKQSVEILGLTGNIGSDFDRSLKDTTAGNNQLRGAFGADSPEHQVCSLPSIDRADPVAGSGESLSCHLDGDHGSREASIDHPTGAGHEAACHETSIERDFGGHENACHESASDHEPRENSCHESSFDHDFGGHESACSAE